MNLKKKRFGSINILNHCCLEDLNLSQEKFRQLLVKPQKYPDSMWHDYYHEVKTYFKGCSRP